MIARLSPSQPARQRAWTGDSRQGRRVTTALARNGRQGVPGAPDRRSTNAAAMAATLLPIGNDIAGERRGRTVVEVKNP